MALKIGTALEWKDGQLYSYQLEGDTAGIPVCDKTDINTTLIRRDKKVHFILVKGTVNQEDITILNPMHQTPVDPVS